MITFEEGTVIATKYRLEYPLARGGMGSVWVAKHQQLDVMVAIKFMAPEYAESAEARSRFEREAKASAQLKSPNVVQVHDYGVEDGTPYLVMELLEGEDLEDRLERVGRLGTAELAVLLAEACKALRRAHESELVHRDLKPGNIFLSTQGDEVVTKILDFGIAKATSPGLAGKGTKTGSLVGSPHYMSPEQVRNSKQVDHRSDLWSMGVIAFRALTGHLPFPGDEIGDILVEICTAPIPVPSTLAPELGPEVDRFFERALARDPAQRFQSAREFAEALSALAGGAGARLSLPAISTPLPTSQASISVVQAPAAITHAGAVTAHGPPPTLAGAPPSGAYATMAAAPPSGAYPLAPGSMGTPFGVAQSVAEPARGGSKSGMVLAFVGGGVALAAVLSVVALSGRSDRDRRSSNRGAPSATAARTAVPEQVEVPMPGSPAAKKPLQPLPQRPISPKPQAPQPPAPAPTPTVAPTPAPTPTPTAPANHDGCKSGGQACVCGNTGLPGKCGTGPHKSGLYCRCD